MSLFLPSPGKPPVLYSAEEEGQYRLSIHQTLRRLAALLGVLGQTVVTVTTTYQVKASDWLIRGDTTAGDFTITLQPAANVTGQVFNVKKTVAAHTLTLAASGAELIDGAASLSWATQYQTYTVISNGTGYDVL